jgi:type IV secretory pathway TrbF-like protein
MNSLATSTPFTPADQRSRSAQIQTHVTSKVIVRNTWLTLGLFALAGAFGWVAFEIYQFRLTVRDMQQHPFVVRVSDIGQASIVPPRGPSYQPTEATLIRELAGFVNAFYTRRRAILLDKDLGYGPALLKVETSLAHAIQDEDRKENWVQDFLQGKTSEYVATTDENDVTVDNVVIHQQQHPKDQMVRGSATVTYHKTFYSADHQATGRKDFEENIEYTFTPRITPSMYLTNPLGLVITYFHASESLSKHS